MNKLVARHEHSYIFGKIPKSPAGVRYGFASRENGLLIESTSDQPFLFDPHASYEKISLWKFDPQPCDMLKTMTYDIYEQSRRANRGDTADHE